jgi:hypothetical protein
VIDWRDAEDIFSDEHPEHDGEHHEEHGADWITCATCGAAWGVHETNGPAALTFEPVSDGDGYCADAARAGDA